MNWEFEVTMALRLALAMACGAVVGWQRERSGHKAGTRTLSLVALGSCAYGIVSTMGGEDSDPTRVAAQVATGIGFLGGGVILRGPAGVQGLTTAAAIWTTAAIGLMVAFGLYTFSVATTLAAYLILYMPRPSKALRKEVASGSQTPAPEGAHPQVTTPPPESPSQTPD